MDIQQMQYVLAVAKYRNFTLAAESCYISQSSLSQQISNLEKELGILLFHRTTRAIQITEAGASFVEMAAEILRNVDLLGQTMSSFSGLLRGTVNIGAITALEKIRFSDLIASFYSCYPHLTLNIYQGKSISLLESLEKQTIDVAFVAQPPNSVDRNIKFDLMGVDEYDLILSESHPLAARQVIDITELKDERFILHHPNQAVSGLCLKACNEAGFTPRVVCRIAASSIALSLVRENLGICFLPSEEVDYYHMEGVRRIKLAKPIKKRIVMATRKNGKSAPPVSNFIQFAERWLHNGLTLESPRHTPERADGSH